MDAERIAELRRFVSTVTQPQIRPFIDLKKQCCSGTYGLAVQMAIEHAAAHGDFAYINSLMTLVDGTPHAGDIIAHCRPRLTFVVTDDKPRRLKKATPEQVQKAAKQVSTKSAGAKTAPRSPTKRTTKKPKVSHDLLDSRLMLPAGQLRTRQAPLKPPKIVSASHTIAPCESMG